MGVLTLNIECQEKGVKKTMQFDPRIVVYDACRLIREKIGPMSGHRNNFTFYLKFQSNLNGINYFKPTIMDCFELKMIPPNVYGWRMVEHWNIT